MKIIKQRIWFFQSMVFWDRQARSSARTCTQTLPTGTTTSSPSASTFPPPSAFWSVSTSYPISGIPTGVSQRALSPRCSAGWNGVWEQIGKINQSDGWLIKSCLQFLCANQLHTPAWNECNPKLPAGPSAYICSSKKRIITRYFKRNLKKEKSKINNTKKNFLTSKKKSETSWKKIWRTSILSGLLN